MGNFHVCATRIDNKEIVCWGDKDNRIIKDIPKIMSDDHRMDKEDRLGKKSNVSGKDSAIVDVIPGYDGIEDRLNIDKIKTDRDDILTIVEYLNAGYSRNCGIFKTIGKLSKVVCWGKNDHNLSIVPDLEKIKINSNFW